MSHSLSVKKVLSLFSFGCELHPFLLFSSGLCGTGLGMRVWENMVEALAAECQWIHAISFTQRVSSTVALFNQHLAEYERCYATFRFSLTSLSTTQSSADDHVHGTAPSNVTVDAKRTQSHWERPHGARIYGKAAIARDEVDEAVAILPAREGTASQSAKVLVRSTLALRRRLRGKNVMDLGGIHKFQEQPNACTGTL